MSIFRPSTLNRHNRNALSGIDVAIIASPHIALPVLELPVLELPNHTEPSNGVKRDAFCAENSAKFNHSNQTAQPENAINNSPNGTTIKAERRNLLDVILNHLAAAGAKRATICIGPDARGIWTDREYRNKSLGQNISRHLSEAAMPNERPLPPHLGNNYTDELSWALSDLSPQTERKWPINLDWAVDWRGYGNLALLSMALPMMRSNPILVVCGDRFQPIDFSGFLAKHRRGGEQVTLLCREANADDLLANEKLLMAHHQTKHATELPGHGGKISLDAQGRVTRWGSHNENSPDFKYLLSGMYLFEHDYLSALCKLLQHSKNEAKSWSIERDIMALRDAGSYAAYVDTTPIYWPDVQTHPSNSKKRDTKSNKIIAFPTETALKPRFTAARNM